MAITQLLIAEGTNHLGMAEVTALTHVDVASARFQRRVGAHAVDLLDRLVLHEEQGRDFDHTTDADGDHGEHQQDAGVGFDFFVFEAHS